MSADSPEIAQAKKALRSQIIRRRDDLPSAKSLEGSAVVARHADLFSARFGQQGCISVYACMGSEIDPAPLCERLTDLGHVLCLPVMIELGQPLVFRQWRPGDALEPKKWGILEPLARAPVVEPDLILLPMVAFDAQGWRLGYGGGFYDRTLARLRSLKTIVAIGLAFDEQEVDAVPHAAYDERLDLVLTPSGLRSFQQMDV